MRTVVRCFASPRNDSIDLSSPSIRLHCRPDRPHLPEPQQAAGGFERQFGVLIPRFGEYLTAKTFSEAMHSCKDQGWVDRYARARRIRDELMEARGAIEGSLTRVQKEQLQELLSELDWYLRVLRKVVRDVQFPVSDAGVEFSQSPAVAPLLPEPWIRKEAEQRRQRIRELTLLLEPSLAKS